MSHSWRLSHHKPVMEQSHPSLKELEIYFFLFLCTSYLRILIYFPSSECNCALMGEKLKIEWQLSLQLEINK